jgi:hypothetical protein
MTTVQTYRDFLDINQAAQYLQDRGFASCSRETIKYLAYETDRLPRPTKVARRAYWKRVDLDAFVESL